MFQRIPFKINYTSQNNKSIVIRIVQSPNEQFLHRFLTEIETLLA